MTWPDDRVRHILAGHGIKTTAKAKDKAPEDYLDMDWGNLFMKASVLVVGLGVASQFLKSEGRRVRSSDDYVMALGFDSKEVSETASKMLKKKFGVKTEVKVVDYTSEGDLIWGVFVPEEDADRIADYMESIVSKYSHVIGMAMGRRRDIRMVLDDFIDGNYKLDDDSYFVIYYKDGSKRRVDRYNYDGEKIKRQNVRNILYMSPEHSEDFSGDVDVDDEYFAEQEKIQKMIKSGNKKLKDDVRL